MKFWWIKIKTYVSFAVGPVSVSWLCIHNFEPIPAFALSIIGTAAALHIMVTEEGEEAYKGQKYLIMRRRHFNDLEDR